MSGTKATGPSPAMFDTVLVANRGEIAVRVIRTLRRLGVRSVAVYSDADADARHVREADTAVRIGPAPAAESYLSIERLLEAAARTGAQAVHPGYGFLAENGAFARACADAGLAFIGPPAGAIELMGDKIRAKETVRAAGVPVVPGSSGSGLTDGQLTAAAREIGMPVLLKPSAGGGGKGMRLVRDEALLADEIAAARREARGAFGDDTLLVERWIDRPRHIEIQVLADGQGHVVHLGERECSLQRRHQKIIEEAPSPLLDEVTRARMGEAAVAAARSCGYVGAGTVEFIVPGDDPSAYCFMEMNTRLQVEHPVTELTVSVGGRPGLDLVEWQLRVAAGEPLPFGQDDIAFAGHAVEARICAETARAAADGRVDFLPSAGTVLALDEPEGEGVRVDSGLSRGTEVGTVYDPMLAKVIAHGPDRPTALRRLRAALGALTVLGVDTNTGFLRRLAAHPAVASGELDTGLVDRAAAQLIPAAVPEEVYATAALLRQAALEPATPRGDGSGGRPEPGGSGLGGPAAGVWVDPFSVPTGWRLGGAPAWTIHRLRVAGHPPVTVRVRGRAHDAELRIEQPDGSALAAPANGRTGGPQNTAAVAARPMGAGEGGAAALVTRTSPDSTVTGASARTPEAEADERAAAHHAAADRRPGGARAAAGTAPRVADPRPAADAGAGTTTPAPADAGAGTSTAPARAEADAAWRPAADADTGADAGAGMRARLIALDEGTVLLDLGGVTHRFRHAAHGASHWLGRDGDAWRVVGHDPVEEALRGGAAAAHAGELTAPMPGTVTVVKAAVGDEVTAGQGLLVVEAMKMEHLISAPHDGTVTELEVTPGSTVAMDQLLAVVTPHEPQQSEERER
ncbi:carbamoyl-phosphate synthase L chain ATP-bindingprotein [Streptomyces iranensis]|uniref:Biotin-dependent 3-methylcrotonyl-coenzyme A carboxylase alpha1 subunit n=2 Tax=Streptomyces iranensis TaxID=576784 RepID=A0A061A2N7_9ACTN|nr:acetyl-CoA/propionyl-CoA carboxylase biotin carboxyl carrier protein [Streptomyces iranensis]CDR09644.1 carbamoyl-phosphate synthase L chain ATP-bindingprotein [Streptomyces iranensis]